MFTTHARKAVPAAMLAVTLAIVGSACASYGTTQRPRPVRYPSSVGYRSPAIEIGYRDGFEAGRSDVRNRERYSPTRSRRYRAADNNYDRRHGSREEYKREYRRAFERGYSEGFRARGRRY
jgi:hypothetical protein